MNILIPRFAVRRTLNWFYAQLKATKSAVLGFVGHEADLSMAYDLAQFERRQKTLVAPSLADLYRFCFDRPMQGAGYAFESRRWFQPASDAAIATTGANTVNFNILDFAALAIIGFYWTVAGTVTAMVMDFDLYARVAAGGSATDKLDGTNGVLSGQTVAQQAVGNILYRDLGHDPGEIDLSPGQSIQAIVTTTTSAGNGLPFCIGYSRAEEFRNLSNAVRIG